MQILLLIMGALVVLILGLVIYSMFLPANVKLERTLFISAPIRAVFEQVNILRNWESWSPWKQKDPGMKIVYGEKESGVGASFSWERKDGKARRGSLTIVESKPPEYIVTNSNFMNKGGAKGYFRFESVTGGTQVTWGIEAHMGANPVRKLWGLVMDKWVGSDFEKGLINLRQVLSK
jgi:hypothetical protein